MGLARRLASRPACDEGGSGRISQEEYALAEAEMKRMVAEGKVSEDDVRARLNEMRKMMGDDIGDDAAGR